MQVKETNKANSKNLLNSAGGEGHWFVHLASSKCSVKVSGISVFLWFWLSLVFPVSVSLSQVQGVQIQTHSANT